ncbi:MAG TPA: DUF2690 domain-containing protein [Streptomyces sp.]|nr:DUF2690 domain-containing protein [Streptomyces sp.]
MPRWKALPEELDPQIAEFTSQLRRLVDRSELSIASVADRTGYSKTSWERYLNGRLLAPKGAVVALAEVTGTHPVHLTTLWELAERAWSRSEMRHDMTMEAIRISQARAALGELGGAPAGGPAGRPGSGGRTGTGGAPGSPGRTATGAAAGKPPGVPQQPTVSDSGDARPANSWNVTGGYGHPQNGRAPGAPGGPRRGGTGHGAGTGTGADGRGKRRRVPLVLAAVGVLAVAAGAFFLLGGGSDKAAGPAPSPSVSTEAELPPGVKCGGDDCTGKDAENMGCGGEFVTTAQSATVGTTVVEVRYSETCGAAWGRVTQAAQGDMVSVTAGAKAGGGGAVEGGGAGSGQSDTITQPGDTSAYTPMVAVADVTDAKACVTLAATGQRGCTE